MLKVYNYTIHYDESDSQDIKFELIQNKGSTIVNKKYKASIIVFKKKGSKVEKSL